jgi:hypothetical protein
VQLPERFLNTDIVIALAIPLGNSGALSFPLIEGKVVEVLPNAVVVKNTKGEELVIPDERIQHVAKVSQIANVPGIMLPQSMRG